MTGKFLIACGLLLAASLVSGTPSAALAATVTVPGDYVSIEAALAAARSGDRVEISPGTYPVHGLVLPDGVVLTGATGDPADVVLDGQGLGRILLINRNGSGSSLSHLTFRNGYAAGATSYARSGGAVFVSSSSVNIANCVFTDNVSDGQGGALRLTNSAALITGCVFRDNRARNGGGGAIDCSFNSSPLIRGSEFTGNSADWGGALSCRGYSSPVVYASVFFANTAVGDKGYGGGAFADIGSEPVFRQVTLYENDARYGGALACMGNGRTNLENCTISANAADVLGGGLFAYESSPAVTASIIAFQDGTGISAEGGTPPEITCSNIFGNSRGDWVGAISAQLMAGANLSADPLFCGTGSGGLVFTLADGSPSGDADDGCGVMGAWPIGCSGAEPTVETFAADSRNGVVSLNWHALLYGQDRDFRLTGSFLDDPDRTWDVPFENLGGGFFEATDTGAAAGGAVVYRLYIASAAGEWILADETHLTSLPAFSGIRDLSAYPNPFNPNTTVSFRLGSEQQARVSVYSPDGRRVAVLADRLFPVGTQTVSWDGRADNGARVGSGLYVVLVEGRRERLSLKITLLK